MKKILFVLLLLFCAGCNYSSTQPTHDTETESTPVTVRPLSFPESTITSEECYLCGPNRPFDIIERPDETVMLLCLNTWTLGDTKMYQYDENGNEAGDSRGSIMHFDHHGEDECRWSFKSNSGHHTCEIKIQYGEHCYLDTDTLCSQLCSKCLNTIYDHAASVNGDANIYCDVLYNTATGDIYPISSAIDTEYNISSFLIKIEHSSLGSEDLVSISYVPPYT